MRPPPGLSRLAAARFDFRLATCLYMAAMFSTISTQDLIVVIAASAIVVVFIFVLRKFIRKAENEEARH